MTNYVYFSKKIIWLIIYIFMINFFFNFKCIYTYPLMYVLHAIFLIIYNKNYV